jgi:hypothetical protein
VSATFDPTLLAADPRMFADFEEQLGEMGMTAKPVDPFSAQHVGPRVYMGTEDGGFGLVRQFAVNSLPTYPGGGPRITVDTAMKFPNIIARALVDLTYQRFVADRILAKGTPEQVAGGAAIFQRAEGIFPDRVAEQVMPRSEWPRSGWTVPDLFAAAVKKLGLEVPISDEARRRNQLDVLARAQRKLANAVIKFVDGLAMTMITTDAAINTYTASNTWTGGSANILGDLAAGRNLVNNADLGYAVDTLVINPAQETAMITDATIRGILPRESTPRNAAITGQPVPLVGLRQILVTNQMPAGKAILLESGTAGSIADEAPLPDEGYNAYNGGADEPTLYVKQYREDDRDETIVRCARFPAMWIAEPKSVVYMQGL